MTANEHVSVVMPAYNAEQFIARALECLFNQTYAPIEILVIDDGSTDGTKKCVDSFAKTHPRSNIIYHKNKKNVGASASRNNGVTQAKGSLVLFCDSDDEFEHTHIASLVQQLQTSKLDAVSALTRHTIDEHGSTLHYKTNHYWGTSEYKLFILGLTGCDLMVKKSAFDAVGGFNEAMKYAEDWDLQVRLFHGGYAYGINDAATVRHREHGGSITSNFSWTSYRLTSLLPKLVSSSATSRQQLAIFTFGTLLHASLKTIPRLLGKTLAYDPLFFIRHPYHIQLALSALRQRINRKVSAT